MKILPDDHPSLSTRCEPVTLEEIQSNKYDNDVVQMVILMLENDGLGLAANQVGIHKRFFVMDFGERMSGFGPNVLYNPRWEPVPMERNYSTDDEMCLSLMKPRKLRRAFRIKATWTNGSGVEVSVDLYGLHARCFQHEVDHLNGIPFSKMQNF